MGGRRPPTRCVLEPIERFDRPALHTVRMGQPEWVPEDLMKMQLRKAMAGAPRSELIDAQRLRRALQRGRLGRKQRRCVDEMVASFRTWEMHLPFTAWGFSIYELAQVVARTYGDRHCWSPWLNLWADDPERPLPAGNEPRRCANREAMDELHDRPRALGEYGGQELHRPSAHQAKGRKLGQTLREAARGERVAVLAAMMAVEAQA